MSGKVEMKERLVGLPEDTEVLIVGGGLAGLCLADALSTRDIDHVVIDERDAGERKQAMYLVSKEIAERWGLSGEFNRFLEGRELISGAVRYSPEGRIEVEMSPRDDNLYGHLSLPQGVLERSLANSRERVMFRTECENLAEVENGMVADTNRGQIRSRIVVDASGWRASMARQYYGSSFDPMICVMYGGHYRTIGYDERILYLVNGWDQSNANWVMPIGQKAAEVMAAQRCSYSEANSWWNSRAEEQFAQLTEFYASQGMRIEANGGQQAMAFSLDHAPRQFYQGRVVPFGDAAGDNSPFHGQLIDLLPGLATQTAEIISRAKEQDTWLSVGENVYDNYLHHPPISYWWQTLARINSLSGRQTNRHLSEALFRQFDAEVLWTMADKGGFDRGGLKRLVVREPIAMMRWVLGSLPSMAQMLWTYPHLYQQLLITTAHRLRERLGSEDDERR